MKWSLEYDCSNSVFVKKLTETQEEIIVCYRNLFGGTPIHYKKGDNYNGS